ncbi:unnamed protein product [Caenorhabditis bovis]|uniref:Uncharacterized protein n=1 Tax=Caenorhabditis bovis TaxID=2654633 RepID=A0A8S1EKS2_9PELO|nr:unnamed protein product [Caenorhabditis bovis]
MTSPKSRIAMEKPMACWRIATAASLIGIGSLMLFAGLISHVLVIPLIVKHQIAQNSRLVDGSTLMEKWKKPDYRMKFRLFVFSTKNPDEFMAGARPEVVRSGPYVFDKKLENRVISMGNGTVKYKRYFTYHFNEADSCQTCILGNRIWIPNMIYQKFVEAASTEGMKAAATTLLSQTAFLEVEVEEMLFEGYKDPFLDKVCEIPFMNFVCETILDIPDRIGLFYEANNTGSKIYEIDDGSSNPADLGKILTIDDETHLDESWWSTEESRRIRGTDGSLFPPFIEKTDRLYVYVAELCRSIWIEFKEECEYKGVRAYRFMLPPSVLDVDHPGNEGFCNPSPKKFYASQNASNCMPRGLLEISRCQRSQPPIAISLPNFLFAADEVASGVGGLNASDEAADSILVDIEPRLGVVLYARRVSQVNIEMWRGENLSFPVNLRKMKSSLIPVLIVNETSEIDDESLREIKEQLYDTEWYAYSSCDILMVIGGIALAIGVLFLVLMCRHRRRPDGIAPQPLPPYVSKGDPK